MNKTMKKIISLVLALIMLMTVSAVAFSVFAADVTDVVGTVELEPAGEEEEAHRMMYQVFWDFLVEIYEFFKYMFYDIFLGR